jgi:hypothetical protein
MTTITETSTEEVVTAAMISFSSWGAGVDPQAAVQAEVVVNDRFDDQGDGHQPKGLGQVENKQRSEIGAQHETAQVGRNRQK